MDFPHGQAVVRLRAGEKVDPYSQKVTRTDWGDPVELPLPGAFVASASSSSSLGSLRQTVTTTKSLYLSDAAADVLVGDRIRWGATTYVVDAKPEADVNPFTGWSPVLEIPLLEVTG